MERELNIINEIKKNNLTVDMEKIKSAYNLAKKYHVGQLRKSGEDYIVHPVEVAKILINMKMDTDTIVAGFLHDIVEDTSITVEEIEEKYGVVVAQLVDGVTKITHLPAGSEKQPENLRKMIIAMAKDVRVIIIKLADRLHNMRTLKYMPAHKKERISKETLEVFAPLAHRIGMAKIKSELEDLCLYNTEPEIYRKLVDLVDGKKREREEYTEKVIKTIQEILKEEDLHCKVSGRTKHFYSIYNKLYKKQKTFNELYDLTALRILVKEKGECYRALGAVHSMWKPVPGRFKDYIAVPKSNGYQSIHTTIVGPEGKFIEIQIRTEIMHEIAEEGIAAHWNYKEGSKFTNKDNVYIWLRKILEFQDEAEDSKEFVEGVTGDILKETVFVFSPKGKVVELSSGATPIDFAFHIHTEIGYKCVGAKVNDKIVPLGYRLQNGDRIEIITSKTSRGPGRDWLNLVSTHSAKNKIRRWIKEKNLDENLKIGKEILEKELLRFKFPLKKLEQNPKVIEVLERYKIESLNEVYLKIATKKINPHLLAERIGKEEEEPVEQEEVKIEVKPKKTRKKNDYGIVIDGLDNTVIRFAKCCTPLPGDKIGGYISTYGDIGIHRIGCKNYEALLERDFQRSIEVRWDEEIVEKEVNKYRFKFTVIASNTPEILMEIIRGIGEHKIELEKVNTGYLKKNGEKYLKADMTILIKSTLQSERLISALRKNRNILDINREK